MKFFPYTREVSPNEHGLKSAIMNAVIEVQGQVN